jgi:hypothetical protein
LISDTLALLSSLLVAFICIIARWEDYEYLVYYRSITRMLMWFAYGATISTFASGIFTVVWTHDRWLAILICCLGVLLLVFTKLLGEWPAVKLRWRLGRTKFQSRLLNMVWRYNLIIGVIGHTVLHCVHHDGCVVISRYYSAEICISAWTLFCVLLSWHNYLRCKNNNCTLCHFELSYGSWLRSPFLCYVVLASVQFSFKFLFSGCVSTLWRVFPCSSFAEKRSSCANKVLSGHWK